MEFGRSATERRESQVSDCASAERPAGLSTEDRATWSALFRKLAEECNGEVHHDSLLRALELAGVYGVTRSWVDEICVGISKYSSLDLGEFIDFMSACRERRASERAAAFRRIDIDGSGYMNASELAGLLKDIGVVPMAHVVEEILEEVDRDASGELSFAEFEAAVDLLIMREGFCRSEYERMLAAFRMYDVDKSGALSRHKVAALLQHLFFSLAPADALRLMAKVDVDGSGSLNEREFLVFMRHVRECEVAQIADSLRNLVADPERAGMTLMHCALELLAALGYSPDDEALREIAEEIGLDDFLSLPFMRHSGSGDSDPGRRRGATLDVVSVDCKAPGSVSISEVWQLLDAWRAREGLRNAEAADVDGAMRMFSSLGPEEIGIYEAGVALRWLGFEMSLQAELQAFHEVDVCMRGRLTAQEFRKLVRKLKAKEVVQVRKSFARLNALQAVLPSPEALEEQDALLRYLGCDAAHAKLPAQRIADAVAVRMALQHRHTIRGTYRLNAGFGPSEVRSYRQAFKRSDPEGKGYIGQTEFRHLCEHLFPELATSQQARPQLLRIVAKIDKGGDGRIDFYDYLRLMNEFFDLRRTEAFDRERMAVEDCRFSAQQVRDFRNIFVDADEAESDTLPFDKVGQLLHRISPMSDGLVRELRQVWRQVVQGEDDPWSVDFPDFLRLMRRLLDIDFASINARVAQLA